MVTGLRRGELCAIKWRHVNLPNGVLSLERSISQRGSRTWEKETKTHQQRRITLDHETVRPLVEHRTRCEARAAALGTELSEHAFVFSAQSGSFHASLRMRAASAAVGGCGLGLGGEGGSASAIGFAATHFQRTARRSAPLRMKWICRTVDAESGRQV
jgi:integrase